MSAYLVEPAHRLVSASTEKARRYATERYRGAVGLNWYSCDPTLRFMLERYLESEGLAWAEV